MVGINPWDIVNKRGAQPLPGAGAVPPPHLIGEDSGSAIRK